MQQSRLTAASFSCFVPLIFLQSQVGYQAQKSLVTKDLLASDLHCGAISVPHCQSVFKH